jgi:hypothetical protein
MTQVAQRLINPHPASASALVVAGAECFEAKVLRRRLQTQVGIAGANAHQGHRPPIGSGAPLHAKSIADIGVQTIRIAVSRNVPIGIVEHRIMRARLRLALLPDAHLKANIRRQRAAPAPLERRRPMGRIVLV